MSPLKLKGWVDIKDARDRDHNNREFISWIGGAQNYEDIVRCYGSIGGHQTLSMIAVD